jgi:hypothetical protein
MCATHAIARWADDPIALRCSGAIRGSKKSGSPSKLSRLVDQGDAAMCW